MSANQKTEEALKNLFRPCGAPSPKGRALLQGSFDFFNHFGVLGIGEVGLFGVHSEGSGPLEIILVLWDQVEVEMAAARFFCCNFLPIVV